MPNEPLVILTEKRESTVVTVAKIVGLVAASPFIVAFGFFAMITVIALAAILMGSGVAFVDFAPWLLAGILLCALLPAVRTRISNKHQIKILKDRIRLLELEVSESKLEALKLHESIEFQRKLDESGKKSQNLESRIDSKK